MQIAKVISTTILFLLPIAPTIAQEKREQEKQPEQKQPQAKPAPATTCYAARGEASPAAATTCRPTGQAGSTAAATTCRAARDQASPAAATAYRATGQAGSTAAATTCYAASDQANQQQHAAQQQAKPAQQQKAAQEPQRSSREQPAGSHGRIPDDRFRASFGREHTFHVNRADFAGGSRRFQYGGYWFAMVEPWPVAWLYTDNVYVDFMNGGYFLCDPVHPGVYLSINIG